MTKMKLLGTYTARGTCTEQQTIDGNPQRIRLWQGTNKIAYKVIDFKVWGTDWDGSANPDAIGKLSKNDIGTVAPSVFMRADDDNQIAWASSSGSTQGGTQGGFADSIIDPENLVVEDLYVYVRSPNATAEDPVNYLVTMEKYAVEAFRGTLEMARDEFDGE